MLLKSAFTTILANLPQYLSREMQKLRNKKDSCENDDAGMKKKRQSEHNSGFSEFPLAAVGTSGAEFFAAAAAAQKKGFCYSKLWILKCIIMEMKSSHLYDHIRENEMLALPSKPTLKR